MGALSTRATTLAALMASIVLTRCAPAEPRPIVYGKESCAYCSMTVSDDRFGAELVTSTGKVHVFDSPECLAGYLSAHPELTSHAQAILVTDFARRNALIPAATAQYRRTTAISSPMGLGVAAFAPGTPTPDGLTGEPMSWAQVIALASRDGEGHEAAR